jgi:hypothetical protein
MAHRREGGHAVTANSTYCGVTSAHSPTSRRHYTLAKTDDRTGNSS